MRLPLEHGQRAGRWQRDTVQLVHRPESGLALAGAGGSIPTKVVREGTADTITIDNGGHAYERLHWAAVPAGDETGADCEPVPAVVKVIPPNETEQTAATWKDGPVCQHGRIRLTPLTTNPEPR